jgi:ABC-type sugar transport system ATPase subunit
MEAEVAAVDRVEPAEGEGSAPLLELRGIGKRFPGVDALVNVDLAACRGEVHALLGANGAGKSTLIALLSGVHAPSAGSIRIAGREATFRTPREAREGGISTVYQELTVLANLTVAENVFLGREPRRRSGLIDFTRLNLDARHLFARYGIDLDPRVAAAKLSPGQQQMVELARALSSASQILILDEPTASLAMAEQATLFAIIERLKKAGLLILYVSHRLEEVFAIADRVTVLRDGKLVATRAVGELSQRDLVRLIVGHEVNDRFDLSPLTGEALLLEAMLTGPAGTSRLSLRSGEILGLAGTLGSGRTRLARGLAGLEPGLRAEAVVDGERVALSSPSAALARGIVYLTEDRKADGLFANLSIVANTTAGALADFVRFGMVRTRQERRSVRDMIARVGLAVRRMDAPVRGLSGGNQQKTLLARALLSGPRILICDEPTRGVDVGAKEQIYRLLVELAANGLGIIVISSEFKELLAISHRLLIVRHGLIRQEVAPTVTEPELVMMAAGLEEPTSTAGG